MASLPFYRQVQGRLVYFMPGTRQKEPMICEISHMVIGSFCRVSGSITISIFSSFSLIIVSCLHFGQYRGKCFSSVSSRIRVRVLFPHTGHMCEVSRPAVFSDFVYGDEVHLRQNFLPPPCKRLRIGVPRRLYRRSQVKVIDLAFNSRIQESDHFLFCTGKASHQVRSR